MGAPEPLLRCAENRRFPRASTTRRRAGQPSDVAEGTPAPLHRHEHTYASHVTFKATAVRILVASPGDTLEERDVARTAIARWNAVHAMDAKVVLIPVGWETDSVPVWGEHPQAILNRQQVDTSDVLIGIFWTRLGTATPDSSSGTVEEIERVAKSGRPILMYFCRKPADISSIDTSQLDALRSFEAGCRNHALYDTYGDAAEFEAKLARALARTVAERFAVSAAMKERVAALA